MITMKSFPVHPAAQAQKSNDPGLISFYHGITWMSGEKVSCGTVTDKRRMTEISAIHAHNED
jgi:hypothetical protein